MTSTLLTGPSQTADGPDLIAVRVDPRTDLRWAELMHGPHGSLFGAPPWITAMTDTYGFTVHADLLVDGAGRPRAGLAHSDIDDFRGRRIACLPFCDRLDPVVEDAEQWDMLISPLLGVGVPISLRCLDARVPLEDGRFVRPNVACWHGTDTSRPFEEVLAGLRPQARQNMRRAERSGVKVRISDSLEDVRIFHALHRRTRKGKYRMLAQPVALFEAIWERFAPSGSVAVGLAEHDGEAVAGALYLEWNGVLYYKFGASRPEALNLRPNELLARESFRYAVERGCHLYDWGLSEHEQPGLVAYKRKLATAERPITFLRAAPESWDNPVGSDAGRMLGGLTGLLTRDDVPDEVTRLAGDLLYRFFA